MLPVLLDELLMEPPSYEEANRQPSAPRPSEPPPPSYDASLHSPPTPPPPYGEAVTTPQDAFPVLTVPTTVTPPSPNNGTIIHPLSQVGVAPLVGSSQTEPEVVATQPEPVPIQVTHLRDVPAVVRCPHCNNVVTTKVKYVAGKSAWCTCVLLSVFGLICGCCLIPFMMRGLQDAHHSCPECENQLHVFTRYMMRQRGVSEEDLIHT